MSKRRNYKVGILTAVQQRKIYLERINHGKTLAELSRIYNVSSDTIRRVVANQIELEKERSKTHNDVLTDVGVQSLNGTAVHIPNDFISKILRGDTQAKVVDDSQKEEEIPVVVSSIGSVFESMNIPLSEYIDAYNQANQANQAKVTVENISDLLVPGKSVRNDFRNPLDQPADIEPDRFEDAEWTCSPRFANIALKDGTTFNADDSHDKFKEICALLISGSIQEAAELIDLRAPLLEFSKGHIEIKGHSLKYKDIEIKSGLVNIIIQRMEEEKPFDYLINFLEKLMLNPSRKAVYRLYDFLVHQDIRILPNGDFIAWKSVRRDFRDHYSGRFDNSVGKTLRMERWLVDDNDTETCSNGFHAGAFDYVKSYGGSSSQYLSCVINPKDVVSIPVDHDDTKMRVCEYYVAKSFTREEFLDLFDETGKCTASNWRLLETKNEN